VKRFFYLCYILYHIYIVKTSLRCIKKPHLIHHPHQEILSIFSTFLETVRKANQPYTYPTLSVRGAEKHGLSREHNRRKQ